MDVATEALQRVQEREEAFAISRLPVSARHIYSSLLGSASSQPLKKSSRVVGVSPSFGRKECETSSPTKTSETGPNLSLYADVATAALSQTQTAVWHSMGGGRILSGSADICLSVLFNGGSPTHSAMCADCVRTVLESADLTWLSHVPKLEIGETSEKSEHSDVFKAWHHWVQLQLCRENLSANQEKQIIVEALNR